MEAEQLTSKNCNSSRIPYLLSRCSDFPRNVEMDAPGLDSLLSVFRAAQCRGLASSKARLPLLQGSSARGQTTASPAAAWAVAGWRGSVSSTARLAAQGPANEGRTAAHSPGFSTATSKLAILCCCDTG